MYKKKKNNNNQAVNHKLPLVVFLIHAYSSNPCKTFFPFEAIPELQK